MFAFSRPFSPSPGFYYGAIFLEIIFHAPLDKYWDRVDDVCTRVSYWFWTLIDHDVFLDSDREEERDEEAGKAIIESPIQIQSGHITNSAVGRLSVVATPGVLIGAKRGHITCDENIDTCRFLSLYLHLAVPKQTPRFKNKVHCFSV